VHGCEAWSLTKGSIYAEGVGEKGAAEDIGPKKRKKQENGENCIMRKFMICSLAGYFTLMKARRMSRVIAYLQNTRSTYRVLVGKREGNK